MLSCLELCKTEGVSCPCEDCRLWIPAEKHYNCINKFIEDKAGDVNHRAQTNAGVSKTGDIDAICTLQEIGDALGMTREGVRQIENKALRKLKRLLKDWK